MQKCGIQKECAYSLNRYTLNELLRVLASSSKWNKQINTAK